MKVRYALCLAAVILMSGCSAQPADQSSSTSVQTAEITFNSTAENMVSSVQSSGKIVSAGTFEITGTEPVVVDTDGEVELVLNNADIRSHNEPAIYIRSAKSVKITIPEGTHSILTTTADEDKAADKKSSSAIWSKSGISIEGTGALDITSVNGGGIKTKDGFLFSECTLSVTSADNAIGAESIAISGGSISLNAGGGSDNGKQHSGGFGRPMAQKENTEDDSSAGKGLKAGAIAISGGSLTADTADDAIHADSTLVISGGIITISTGDDAVHSDESIAVSGGEITAVRCYEGVEAPQITVSGGRISVTAEDDGFNAASGTGEETFMTGGDDSSIIISGGDIYISSAGDGLDSNGTVLMSGGSVTVSGPENGANGALDFDGVFEINGGTLIAYGSAGMAQAPTKGTVNTIFITSDLKAGSTVSVSENGNTVLEITPDKNCQTLVISSPELKTGSEYKITADGEELFTVVISEQITYAGERAFGGFGGFPGGGPGGRDNFPEDNVFSGFPPFGGNDGDRPEPPQGADFPEKPDGFPFDKDFSPDR